MRRFHGNEYSQASAAVSSNVHSGAKKREPFYCQGAIALPAVGVTTPIVQFTVPTTKNGYIWKIGMDYVGAGFVEGSGAIIYRMFHDAALRRAVRGFNNLTASVGAVNAPFEIGAPIQIYENEVPSIAVNNVSLVVGGAQLVATIVGWFYPRSEEDQVRWP